MFLKYDFIIILLFICYKLNNFSNRSLEDFVIYNYRFVLWICYFGVKLYVFRMAGRENSDGKNEYFG